MAVNAQGWQLWQMWGSTHTHAVHPEKTTWPNRDGELPGSTFCGRPFVLRNRSVIVDAGRGQPSCGRCRQLIYAYQRRAVA